MIEKHSNPVSNTFLKNFLALLLFFKKD